MLGRPPGRDWFPSGGTEIVVCGTGVVPADWYRALPTPDISDLEQVLYTLAHAGESAFDAVYCDFEHAMVNAAVVARHVGASHALSVSTALLGRDKLAQKRAVTAAGLRTATVDMVPADPAARAAFVPAMPYPVIVKPVFGSAARGVRLVDSPETLASTLDSLAEREPAVCEEFVDGVEYHLDAAVCGGRLALLSVGRYLSNIMDTGLTKPTGSVVLPVEGNEALYARAEHLVRGSLDAFGLTDGVVHLEAFDTAAGMYFSECGFRRGGGKMTDAVSAGTETDHRRTSCLASLGLLPAAPLVRPHRAAAWIMFKVEPGVVERLPADEDFAGIDGVWQLSMRRDLVGRYVPAMEGVYQYLGFVLVTAPDNETAHARLRQAAEVFHAGVVVSGRTVAV